jgi:MFS family permease
LPSHWKLYLPVVLVSFAFMVPPILYADRRNRPKPVLAGAVALLVVVECLLPLAASVRAHAFAILAFFVAFNVLEALLPSMVSRLAPAQARGTAIGVYNTTQTMGLFCGGLAGGWLAKHYGAGAVYVTCAVLSGLWLAAALRMRPLPAMGAAVNEVSSLTLSIASGVNLEGLSEALAAVRGVREAEVLARERIARLKVVPEQWDEGSVRKLLSGER